MPCASSASSSGLRRSTRNEAPPRFASVIVTCVIVTASSDPYIRSAVASRIARLMTAGRTVRLLAEIDEEIRVDRHAPAGGVAVDHQHAAAVLPDVRVELVVPRGEQRGRDVEPLAVERELDHLRPAGDAPAVDDGGSVQQAAHPDLAGESRMRGVRDVVLANVSVQPVAEVEEPVVHRDQDHADQARHRDRPLRVAYVLDIDDLFPDPFAVPLVPMDDVGRERGADKTVARIRVVMEADFERHQPVLAQVHGLLDALALEIPEVDLAAVLEVADLL